MKEKYRVTAFSLQSTWALKNNVWTLVHRWKRINSWDCETKSFAFRLARHWTNLSIHKATIVKLKKGGQKRGKR